MTLIQVAGAIGTVVAVIIMLSRDARNWLSGRCTSKYLTGDVGAAVHFAAWTLAMVGAMSDFIQLVPPSDQQPDLWLIWVVFGVVTMVQQFTVWLDFQQMSKSDRALIGDYGHWIDMRAEVILRWTIVVALYVGVGEIYHIPGIAKTDQFKYGALIVFLGCMLWNIGALVIASKLARSLTSTTSGKTTFSSMRGTHQWVLVTRLCLFALSSVLGAIYWVLAITIWKRGPLLTAILLVVYIILLLLIIALRTTRVLGGIVFLRHEEGLAKRRLNKEEQKAWEEEIEQIYGDMAERSKKGRYKIQCGTTEITVLPEVYAPGYFSDSMWFAEKVSTLVNGRSVLEIGTGTGLIAISAILNGATRCVATDINSHAVENARLNVQAAKLEGQIEVRGGNVYDEIAADERFDVIFWAHPFNYTHKKIESQLRLSGKDYRYEGLEAYLVGAKQHIERKGRILLGTGDSADVKRLIRFALKNRMDVQALHEEELPLRVGGTRKFCLYLCELVEWS